MNKQTFWCVCLIMGIALFFTFFPEFAFAQGWGASGFESKLNNLTSSLINVVLPAVSILGLVYAAILATTGDTGAKQRMVMIIIASIIGFLAPIIINWFKSASGV